MKQALKILTVIGARPQIIKSAAISRAVAGPFAGKIEETVLHTGQHYDSNMSEVFFQEMGMPAPGIQLGVGSDSHAVQIARMMEGIEKHLLSTRPDVLLLYGDTNSTLAGALAAAKHHVPVAHVEAGLRSFNKSMPEELNRIVSDQCSSWLFCPTEQAVTNLLREGFALPTGAPATIDHPHVLNTGDIMYDNSLHFAELAGKRSNTVLQQLGLQWERFILATIHRDSNTDHPERLAAIMNTLLEASAEHNIPVVLPLHPRTKKYLETHPDQSLNARIAANERFHIVPPVGFLDMVDLERNARIVVTDSGGVQKEAFFFGRPAVVLRPETEWVELVEHGQAELVDADPRRINAAVERFMHQPLPKAPAFYGDGHAAERICAALLA